MGEYLIQGATLTAIADAIRAKTGNTDSLIAEDMSNAINSLAVSNLITGTVIATSTTTLSIPDITKGQNFIGFSITDSSPQTTYTICVSRIDGVVYGHSNYRADESITYGASTPEEYGSYLQIDDAGTITRTSNIIGGFKSNVEWFYIVW